MTAPTYAASIAGSIGSTIEGSSFSSKPSNQNPASEGVDNRSGVLTHPEHRDAQLAEQASQTRSPFRQ